MSRTGAAAVVGIHRDTFFEWMKDPDWAAQVEEAEAKFEAYAVGRIRRASDEAEVIEQFDQKGNVTRITRRSDWRGMAWLIAHHPKFSKVWREERGLQVSGPEGGPVQVGVIEFRPSQADIAGYLAALSELPEEIAGPMLPDGFLPRLAPGVEPEVIVLEPMEREADAVLAPAEPPTASPARATLPPSKTLVVEGQDDDHDGSVQQPVPC
jgi:hypothetical protein